jgi:hypothetical protein
MTSRRRREVLARVVVVVGLYQGGVPLVARGAFGAEQRFAPAASLGAPWWWLACVVIVAVAVALAVVLEPADPPVDTSSAPVAAPVDAAPQRSAATADLDALAAVVVLAGFYNGVAPFVARLVLGGDLRLALPLYLPAPWWWLTSAATIVGAVAALEAIERAKHRRGGP